MKNSFKQDAKELVRLLDLPFEYRYENTDHVKVIYYGYKLHIRNENYGNYIWIGKYKTIDKKICNISVLLKTKLGRQIIASKIKENIIKEQK